MERGETRLRHAALPRGCHEHTSVLESHLHHHSTWKFFEIRVSRSLVDLWIREALFGMTRKHDRQFCGNSRGLPDPLQALVPSSQGVGIIGCGGRMEVIIVPESFSVPSSTAWFIAYVFACQPFLRNFLCPWTQS